MSDSPERNVLRDLLPKLKKKFAASQQALDRLSEEAISLLYRYPEDDYVSVKRYWLRILINQLRDARENTSLYVEVLERLSEEYDQTLSQIFDAAEHLVEEMEKNTYHGNPPPKPSHIT